MAGFSDFRAGFAIFTVGEIDSDGDHSDSYRSNDHFGADRPMMNCRAVQRFKPMIPAAAPEIFRRSQPAGKDRPDGENDQRQRHHRRRFMEMRFGMRVGPALAMKHHEELAKHVERGHARW